MSEDTDWEIALDWEVALSEQAKAKMAEDPEAAAMIREFSARMRQVLEGVDPTDAEAVDAALTSIGMQSVTDLDELARIDELERQRLDGEDE